MNLNDDYDDGHFILSLLLYCYYHFNYFYHCSHLGLDCIRFVKLPLLTSLIVEVVYQNEISAASN